MYCSQCEMGLNGAAISDFDGMCNAGATMYCRPGQTPTYGYTSAPIAQPVPQPRITMDILPGDPQYRGAPATGFVPSGFWDRNAPQMTPPFAPPTQDWVPDPTRPAIVGSMAPAAYAAQESAGIMPLLIAAAAAYFLS